MIFCAIHHIFVEGQDFFFDGFKRLGTFQDGLEVIDEVDLASRVDGDLIARRDAETRVVVRAEVHDTFAGGRISLLVDCAGNGQLLADACGEIAGILELRGVDIESRRLGTRGDVGACSGRNTVLDVGTSQGIRMEGLDVENDGNNVEVKPEASEEVGSLRDILVNVGVN